MLTLNFSLATHKAIERSNPNRCYKLLIKLQFYIQVDKKRHLGNDIVAIVFQDSNTPFCPTLMKTKVTHAYVVVQPMEIDGPTQYKVRSYCMLN